MMPSSRDLAKMARITRPQRQPYPYGQGGGLGEQTLSVTDWSGGLGERVTEMTPQSLRTAWYSDAPAGVVGGCDGSWGDKLLLGPLITDVGTLVSSKPIRAGSPFKAENFAVQKYYLGCGSQVFQSTNGTTGWTSVYDHASVGYGASTCRKLVPFQGTNAVPCLFIAFDIGPYVVYDGHSFVVDSAGTLRSQDLTSFLRYNTATALYEDDTAAVATGTAGVQADFTTRFIQGHALGPADLGGTAEYLLVGSNKPFRSITWTLGTNANGTASVAHLEYWNGSAWVAVTGLAGVAATPLAVGETWTFNRPNATWKRSVPTNVSTLLGGAYYARAWFATTLDSLDIDTITVGYAEEALGFGTVSKQLYKVGNDGTTIEYTETGGQTAAWIGTIDPAGSFDATFIDMGAVAGAIYIRRSDGLVAPNDDGHVVPFESGVLSSPPVQNAQQAFCVWGDDSLYFTSDETVYQFIPGVKFDSVGPERLMALGEKIGGRVTALCPDRSHFLYACYQDDGGTNWLLKYGTYRGGSDVNNVQEWQRYDVWHAPVKLGSRSSAQVTAIATWRDSSGQPVMLLGDSKGLLSSFTLPKGFHPLGASSGYSYCPEGYMVQPRFDGLDPDRKLTAYATTIRALGLSATSGHETRVKLSTKGPKEAASVFDTNVRATFDGSEADSRKDFTDASSGARTFHSDYGLEWRLHLRRNPSDATVTPQLDLAEIHWMAEVRTQQRLQTVQVVIGRGIRTHNNLPIPLAASDWATKLEALVGSAATLRRLDGATETVLVRATDEVASWRDEQGELRRVYQLTLASAE